jgi:hypothetical protein
LFPWWDKLLQNKTFRKTNTASVQDCRAFFYWLIATVAFVLRYLYSGEDTEAGLRNIIGNETSGA